MDLSHRLHHVSNGDSLSSRIAAAGIPGSRSLWCDILHEGPVPASLSHEQLCATRARYLAEYGYGAYEDFSTAFREWQGAIDRPSYDELVLWFEHDLFDQLNLIQLLDRLAERRPDARLSLVSIDQFANYQPFRGMGELKPEEITTLFPARQPVLDTQLALAREAWRAFRAPTPAALTALVAGDTSALPFLGPALSRHLEEFPSEKNGLSRTEERILRLVEHAPVGIGEVFAHVHDEERYFFVGDSSFWTIVVRLATASPALLDVEIADASHAALPHGTIRITEPGRDVLSGAVDRIELCGIDRWLGGVHVTGDTPFRRPALGAV
jgi:hypothetical protein